MRRRCGTPVRVLRQKHEAAGGLPPECLTENVSPVIDWEKTGAWMAENNMPLEATYTVQVKVKQNWHLPHNEQNQTHHHNKRRKRLRNPSAGETLGRHHHQSAGALLSLRCGYNE